MGVQREGIRAEVRQKSGRGRQDRCDTCVCTTHSLATARETCKAKGARKAEGRWSTSLTCARHGGARRAAAGGARRRENHRSTVSGIKVTCRSTLKRQHLCVSTACRMGLATRRLEQEWSSERPMNNASPLLAPLDTRGHQPA